MTRMLQDTTSRCLACLLLAVLLVLAFLFSMRVGAVKVPASRILALLCHPEPQSTECSMICATPVESFGVVLKPIMNTLFLSSFFSVKTLAPVPMCSYRDPSPRNSSMCFLSTNRYFGHVLFIDR